MKSLNDFINNSNSINESRRLNYDEVYNALYNFFNSDDFPADPGYRRKCYGWEALEKNGMFNVIEYVGGWDVIADEIGCTEDDLQDYLDDDKIYDQLEQQLLDELN